VAHVGVGEPGVQRADALVVGQQRRVLAQRPGDRGQRRERLVAGAVLQEPVAREHRLQRRGPGVKADRARVGRVGPERGGAALGPGDDRRVDGRRIAAEDLGRADQHARVVESGARRRVRGRGERRQSGRERGQQLPLRRLDLQLDRRIQAVIERLQRAVHHLHGGDRIGDRRQRRQRLGAAAKQSLVERRLGALERHDVQLGHRRALVHRDRAAAVRRGPEHLRDRAGGVEHRVLVLDAIVLDPVHPLEAAVLDDVLAVTEQIQAPAAAQRQGHPGRDPMSRLHHRPAFLLQTIAKLQPNAKPAQSGGGAPTDRDIFVAPIA
jgi:hypothetical protein